jgi:hypothetical protein
MVMKKTPKFWFLASTSTWQDITAGTTYFSKYSKDTLNKRRFMLI